MEEQIEIKVCLCPGVCICHSMCVHDVDGTENEGAIRMTPRYLSLSLLRDYAQKTGC